MASLPYYALYDVYTTILKGDCQYKIIKNTMYFCILYVLVRLLIILVQEIDEYQGAYQQQEWVEQIWYYVKGRQLPSHGTYG